MQTSSAALASSEPTVIVRNEGGIATLTLNRPKQFNALSEEVLIELDASLAAIKNDESVRVVVIAGNGPAFCAGHDLKEMRAKRNEDFVHGMFLRCTRFMLGLTQIPQPVIARVHGLATAAGCQLVAACDLAVASTEARFATSGVNYGLFCATPGVPLTRNVARKHSFEMLFTGDFIDAETALRYGLVNRVVAPDKLDDEVAALTSSILAKPLAVVAAGKSMFYRQLEMNIDNAYELACRTITDNMLADDAAEGIDAFMQKRAPRWQS